MGLLGGFVVGPLNDPTEVQLTDQRRPRGSVAFTSAPRSPPPPTRCASWQPSRKWDGFRALVSVDAGKVVLRSRRGTETGPAFPEIVAGAAQLPDATAMDGVM
ncbi:hypothetical protein GCM10017668_00480 [Streptomyces tuirus]|uniref:ATP-dependent DNA ligase family profile domain-containing protein n=1 Tax=Streptomyces tuirus TaxID=68278 RepID=A0A7G1NAH9_9ACTN|nr:hypothetical protein GCM10017668_00480 [Streptomyces tuirus]